MVAIIVGIKVDIRHPEKSLKNFIIYFAFNMCNIYYTLKYQ